MRRLLAGTAFLALLQGPVLADSYVDSVEQWRQEREENLKADDGWLSVAGLFWLRDGANTIGSGEGNRIQLPRGPERLGVVEVDGGAITLRYADKSQHAIPMLPDQSGEPTLIHVEDLTFWVIERGDRLGIRLRDPASAMRRDFTHCNWYPVKPGYRIVGKFIPYDEPRTFTVPSVIGVPEEMESPGEVEFVINGQTLRLKAALEGDSLWFIFRDSTSGHTTYGAGRFLDADAPKDGQVILDFNKAYNPPCTFTPYATCPLPPKENRLKIPIEAGEQAYGDPNH